MLSDSKICRMCKNIHNMDDDFYHWGSKGDQVDEQRCPLVIPVEMVPLASLKFHLSCLICTVLSNTGLVSSNQRKEVCFQLNPLTVTDSWYRPRPSNATIFCWTLLNSSEWIALVATVVLVAFYIDNKFYCRYALYVTTLWLLLLLILWLTKFNIT